MNIMANLRHFERTFTYVSVSESKTSFFRYQTRVRRKQKKLQTILQNENANSFLAFTDKHSDVEGGVNKFVIRGIIISKNIVYLFYEKLVVSTTFFVNK